MPLATAGPSRSSPSTAPSWRFSLRRSSPTASGGQPQLGERAGARAVEPFELLVVDDVAAFDPALASFLSFDDADAYDGALALPQPLVRVSGGLAGPPEIRASTVGRASRLLLADVVPEHAGRGPGGRRDAALRRRQARAGLAI